MKEYYEEWVNPKTEKKEKILVQEYDLSDLKDKNNSHHIKAGKNLIHNTTSDTYYYRYIPYKVHEELRKIVFDKDRYFQEAIEPTYNLLLCFFSRYARSDNKKRMLKLEIEKFEQLLFEEKLPIYTKSNIDFPIKASFYEMDHWGHFNAKQIHGMLSVMRKQMVKNGKINADKVKMPEGPKVPDCVPRQYNTLKISRVRELYNEMINQGIRSYERTSENLEIESISRFYNQLKVYSTLFYKEDYTPNDCGLNKVENNKMNKCKRYPNCECFNDYIQPASEIVDTPTAEKFAQCMQELDTFLSDSKFISAENSEQFLLRFKKILSQDLFSLFKKKTIFLLDFHYKWKMPYASELDLIKNILDKGYPDTKKEIGEVLNNFDNTPFNEVLEYFSSELVAKKHLTQQELQEYLNLAFTLKKLPKNKFVLKNQVTKKKVYSIFYKFYTEIAGKPHGKQTEYANLLGGYFKGYSTETVRTNFSK